MIRQCSRSKLPTPSCGGTSRVALMALPWPVPVSRRRFLPKPRPSRQSILQAVMGQHALETAPGESASACRCRPLSGPASPTAISAFPTGSSSAWPPQHVPTSPPPLPPPQPLPPPSPRPPLFPRLPPCTMARHPTPLSPSPPTLPAPPAPPMPPSSPSAQPSSAPSIAGGPASSLSLLPSPPFIASPSPLPPLPQRPTRPPSFSFPHRA
mmetsp:Transcript_26580/g.78955  ORF Transcript_26580/g.78955 Transcript_26580/m.78955 type:complete len:210 (-) Transcript_26580:1845-2474(-)